MKICQLLHAMTTGGAEVLADRMARHLVARHEVVFACLDGVGEIGDRLRGDGFVVHGLQRGQGIDRACVRRLSNFLVEQQIDVVHAHQYTPFFYAAAARGWRSRPPIVFTEHGRFHPDFPSWKRGLFNRLMLRKSDRVIAVGNQVKRALIDKEWIARKRIEVIYNGINLAPYEGGDPVERGCLRATLGLSETSVIAIQVARLDPIKDHVSAVRAVKQAVKRAPDFHLVIVGEGPARETIETEIERCGVAANVHLLGLRSDVPALLKQADILLLTSVSEGIPLTLIEGMACGLPCVSTDVGGVAEVLSDGQTGLLVPAGDPIAIAEALARLADDPELRNELGGNGKTVARERFSEQQMMAAYDEIFDSLEPTS